jgi:hypothetical protein
VQGDAGSFVDLPRLTTQSTTQRLEDEESPVDKETVYWQQLLDLGLIKTIRSQLEPVDLTPYP